MENKWQWWAGSGPEFFEVGPFDSAQEAITQAKREYVYNETETEPEFIEQAVYVVEARGKIYDCDNCGVVSEACGDCAELLEHDEPHWFFKQTRNLERVVIAAGPVGRPTNWRPTHTERGWVMTDTLIALSPVLILIGGFVLFLIININDGR